MDIIINNLSWMFFNAALAILPALFAWFAYRGRNLPRVIFVILCLAFIPNTIYIVTDLIYVPQQLPLLNGLDKVLLITEFFIFETIGIVTFLLSVNLMEKVSVAYLKNKKYYSLALVVLLNFLISFGVVMGRFQRTNSWEFVSDINKVIADSFAVLLSQHLLFAVITFGFFANAVYFLFRGKVNKIKI